MFAWLVLSRVPLFDFIFGMSRSIDAKKRVLLYHVDHAILGALLREFAANRRWSSGALPSREPEFISLALGRDDITVIAPALRLLKPTSVRLSDDEINLEFGGTFEHFGVRAFRPGLEGSGTKRLGAGLWFYAENGRCPDPG